MPKQGGTHWELSVAPFELSELEIFYFIAQYGKDDSCGASITLFRVTNWGATTFLMMVPLCENAALREPAPD